MTVTFIHTRVLTLLSGMTFGCALIHAQSENLESRKLANFDVMPTSNSMKQAANAIIGILEEE